jgi:hypothetical protein
MSRTTRNILILMTSQYWIHGGPFVLVLSGGTEKPASIEDA